MKFHEKVVKSGKNRLFLKTCSTCGKPKNDPEYTEKSGFGRSGVKKGVCTRLNGVFETEFSGFCKT